MRFNKATLVIVIVSALLLGFLAFVNSPNKLSTTRSERISGAYDALNFWAMARAYPNDDIPNAARYAAFEQAKLNKLYKTENLQTTNQWKTIGPHNKGGRTNAIAFNPQNPNTMYAGSASGGLWRSYTGGVGVDGCLLRFLGAPMRFTTKAKASKTALLQGVAQLRLGGATALGPALALALGITSKTPGSKIVLCTDGTTRANA